VADPIADFGIANNDPEVRAVRYLIGRWTWRRRVGLLALVVLAAGSLSFVMLAALGAHRAGGAWERLETRSRNDDLLLDVTSLDAARSLTEQVATIPGVKRVASLAYAYIIPKGREESFFGGVLLPLGRGLLDTFWRPVLSDGRLPNPTRADEVVVNTLFVRQTGKSVGEHVQLTDPLGLVRQRVTIVGVGTLPVDFTFAAGSPIALPTPAFSTRWATALEQLFETFGTENVGPAVVAAAEPGVTDDELQRRVLAAVPSNEILGVETPSATAETVTDTLDLQRTAFAIVAIVSGISALAMLALLLTQVTFLRAEEVTALRAIGLDRRQRRLAVLLPGIAVAVGGVLGGIALTIALEGLVPTGLAEKVDVGRTVRDDSLFLVGSALVALAVLCSAVAGLAWRSTADGAEHTDRRGLGARLTAWPALSVGLRAASGGLTRQGRRQAIAALLAVGIGVVGATATGVVVSSRDRLSLEPSLSGVFYDAYIGTYGDPANVDEDRDILLAAPRISDVATVDTVIVNVDGLAAEGIVVTIDKGHLGAPVLSGRRAVRGDELVVTPSYLRRLAKNVGDSVKVDGPKGARVFRVVGTAALPFAGSGASGEQVAITASGRDALGLEPEGYVLGVRLRDPQSAHALAERSGLPALCLGGPLLKILGVRVLPGAKAADLVPCVTGANQRVINLRELGAAPALLVAFLALVALAGLGYFLGATLRRTARELAVLRALGFTRRQVASVLLVQAATIGLVGALVAVPFGIVLGRGAWRAVTDNLGVVDRTELSVLGTVGAPAAAVVAAIVLAVVPIVIVLRQRAAAPLRAE
jgi:hypothetical protein